MDKIGESLENDLGESAAPSKETLKAQNQQLQGAIQAIEGGTPPPGMEAMMGGAAAGKAPENPKANAESAAISKGIKMAMGSVKPLMDKYVATARALTDKYTALQSEYKGLKAKYNKRPSKAALKKAVAAAASAKGDAASHKFLAAEAKQQAAMQKMKAHDMKEIDRLTAKVAQQQAFISTQSTDFKVQLKMAREKAKANMDMLHNQLKDMIMEQLQKRDKAERLKRQKQKLAGIKEKQTKEQVEKKDAEDQAIEARKKRDAREKTEKADAVKELKAKNQAAQEVKTLNRNTVMRKARSAMDDARRAARMARTLVRTTARNLDDARLKNAKLQAVDDIKALSKLRQHEDLSNTAIASANEKKEKIARYQFGAKAALKKAETRLDMVKKQNRYDARHAATMRDLAIKAKDKAKLLKVQAQEAAANNDIKMPDLNMPEARRDPTPKSSGERAAEKKAVKALAGTLAPAKPAKPAATKAVKKVNKTVKKAVKKLEKLAKTSKGSKAVQKAVAKAEKKLAKMSAKKDAAKAEAKADKKAIAKAAKKAKQKSLNATRGEGGTPSKKVKKAFKKLLPSQQAKAKKLLKITPSRHEKKIMNAKLDADKKTGLKPAGGKKAKKSSLKGHAEREKIRRIAAKHAKEIKGEIKATNAETATEQKKEAIDRVSGKKLTGTAEQKKEAMRATKFAGKIVKAVITDGDAVKKKVKNSLKKDSVRTTAVKIQAAATEAKLKSQLAEAKISKATALRRLARVELKQDGKRIPKAMFKGGLDQIRKRTAALAKEASTAVSVAQGNTKEVIGAQEDESDWF